MAVDVYLAFAIAPLPPCNLCGGLRTHTGWRLYHSGLDARVAVEDARLYNRECSSGSFTHRHQVEETGEEGEESEDEDATIVFIK